MMESMNFNKKFVIIYYLVHGTEHSTKKNGFDVYNVSYSPVLFFFLCDGELDTIMRSSTELIYASDIHLWTMETSNKHNR